MENATKALLIAGAVLLVIMIISVGLMIFNSANGQIEGAISQMNQQEKDQFNQKFLGYEGSQVSGSTVKTLISTVIAHNGTMTKEGTTDKKIKMKITTGTTQAGATAGDIKTASDKEADLNKARAAINSAGKYSVKCDIGAGGIVTSIDVTRNTSV